MTMKAQKILQAYHAGLLTRAELKCYLAELAPEEIHCLEANLKAEVDDLRELVRNGKPYVFGGITHAEVEERAKHGSPAAQAILDSGKKS